jgi:hypothetical protein
MVQAASRPNHPFTIMPLQELTFKDISDRHLRSNLYKNAAWLCSCSMMNEQFFWSGLFCTENSTWTSAGFDYLHNFYKVVERHENIGPCIREPPKKFCKTFYISEKINRKYLKLFLRLKFNIPLSTAAPRKNTLYRECAGGHQKDVLRSHAV